MLNKLLNIFKDNSIIEIRKLIFDECLKYIDRSWNARVSFMQFYIAVNIAYIGAFYFLINNKGTIFIPFISILIYIINISFFIMYIREHNAAKDNQNQINNIYESINEKYAELFNIKSQNFKKNDNFRGITFGITLSLFFVFNLLPLVLLSLFNNYPLCYVILNFITISFSIALFIIIIFYINNNDLWKNKISKCKYPMLILGIFLNYIFVLILVILSFIYIDI